MRRADYCVSSAAMMPGDAVGVDLGQRPGDAETFQLRDTQVVHGRLAVVSGLVAGSGRFHRSFLQ
jgi:hypothetical protein